MYGRLPTPTTYGGNAVSASGRSLVVLAPLGVLIVLLIVLFPRVKPRADGSQGAAGNPPAVPATEDRQIPPTSEALIAHPLPARSLTSQQSRRQRGYPICGHPGGQPAFRRPVIDWEAGDRLFHEVAKKELTL